MGWFDGGSYAEGEIRPPSQSDRDDHDRRHTPVRPNRPIIAGTSIFAVTTGGRIAPERVTGSGRGRSVVVRPAQIR